MARETTIQQKMVRVILLITGAGLLLACTAILSYEFLTFRKTTLQQVSTLGQIIATNSTAALAFVNQDDANEILSAIKAEQPVVGAGLYNKEGQLFSQYPLSLSRTDFPVAPQQDGYRFTGGYVIGFQSVVQGENRLGTLYLKWDMRTLYERFMFYGGSIVFIMTSCFLAAAYLLSRTLQQQISRPILSLAETAKAVSDYRDYSVRATKLNDDELGRLTDAFNQMLAQINEQTGALRESEARVRAVLDSALSAVIVIDADGRIIDWNPRAERMFGWTSAEVRGGELALTIIPERFREAHRNGMIRYLSTGEGPALNRTIEMTALRRDGSEFPVELSIGPTKSGDVITFCGFVTDITERKEAATKLQVQLSRLELLHRITRAIAERQDLPSIFQVVIGRLEADLPVDFGCVCVYDPFQESLTVKSVGPQSQPLAAELAMTEQAVVPMDENGLGDCLRGQLLYEPDTSTLLLPLRKRLASCGLRSLVVAPLPVEGKAFAVLIVARRAPHSFSSADCEFLRQLSEHAALAAHQAELNDALKQAYEDLRQTQQAVMQQERLRALGEMASGIAHDINNAISPVSLYTESLLEQEPNLSPRARDYLETIKQAVGDVAQTVAGMREFYRQREGQLLLAPVQLNHLVQQVAGLTRAMWSDMPQRRGVAIQMQMDLLPELPLIMGVESEIREALTNLIFNAVDAMPEGGTLTLRSGVTGKAPSGEGMTEQQVHVDVIDSGIGMDEDTRRRCMEPFFTTKGERGTGLGLAMVYGVVQRHSADLRIDSEVGKGTTVRLSFSARALPFAGPVPLTTSAVCGPLHILVVDDDPFLLKSLTDALQSDGHRVVNANNGQGGLDAFQAAQERGDLFDVVITDLGMPLVDGRKVAGSVKKMSASTPVILLTGWGQRLTAEGDIPPHVDRVVNKPPRLQDLREALMHCCPSPTPLEARDAKQHP